jgi:predicted transcriptional regulator
MSSEEVGRLEPAPGSDGRAEGTLNLADPKAMRAMAHPVRMALMELLAVAPTLTATRASEVLGESPANCAFHLRTLAKYGFIREAGGGKGRERPWARVHRSISLSTKGQADYQAELAARTLSAAFGERMLQRIRHAYTNAAWPKGWEDAVFASDSVRFLTAEEAIAISREIRAIIDRYEGRREDPGSRPAGALPVEIAHYIFPLAELAGVAGQPDRPQAADNDR